MNFMEDVRTLVSRAPQLAFCKTFLEAHPDAELYLVGGAVRDLVTRRFIKDADYDFVIRGLPAQSLESWFSQKGSLNFVGTTFGVYKFLPTGFSSHTHRFIDLALPRTEQSHKESSGGYREFDIQSDPTLPLEDDLSRRDFTINAMAINMATGDLLDPFKGMQDLNEQIIKAVGDPTLRFQEDLTRILRGLRFASELTFHIETETLEAMKRLMPRLQDIKDDVYIVSRETVGLELAKAFSRQPMSAGVWLDLSGALPVLFPGVSSQAVERLKNIKPEHPELALTLLLADLPAQEARLILINAGLNTLPKDSPLRIDVDTVTWGIERLREANAETWIQGMRAHRFEKLFMNGKGAFLFALLNQTGRSAIAKLATERKTTIEACWSVSPYEPIPPLISGDDVLSSGIEAGPRVRQLLEHLRDEQLEGRLKTREEALKTLRQKNHQP